MKKLFNDLSVWLMVLSITLLLTLQGLWFRSEYRSAVATFGRETNLIFRSALLEARNHIFIDQVDLLTDQYTKPEGSIVMKIDTLHQQTDQSYVLRVQTKSFNADSMAVHFSKALTVNNINISHELVEKDVQEVLKIPRDRDPKPFASDNDPFTTDFIPFGKAAYAAHFPKANVYLLRQMLPQIGFSIMTTLAVILSFILINRSLRTHRRLLAQKEDFIGNITHELKTPVATVGVALEAMRDFDVLQDKVKTRAYLDMASHELNRLSLMTDKILHTTFNNPGEDIRIKKTWVDTITLAEHVMSAFSLVAKQKDVLFVFSHEGDTNYPGDKDHLTQIFYNLVDNALKYASEGPEIAISLSGTQKTLTIRVSDHGPGIPSHLQSKIFEKFFRAPTGNIHTVKGYGLGLHYVQKLVKSYGGKISVESSPGKGSHFVIKLPKHEG